MTGLIHVPSFDPGDGIAWRNCPRDAARVERPSYVVAMTVVHDTPDELALFRRPGTGCVAWFRDSGITHRP
jgi:hypothetical protein